MKKTMIKFTAILTACVLGLTMIPAEAYASETEISQGDIGEDEYAGAEDIDITAAADDTATEPEIPEDAVSADYDEAPEDVASADYDETPEVYTESAEELPADTDEPSADISESADETQMTEMTGITDAGITPDLTGDHMPGDVIIEGIPESVYYNGSAQTWPDMSVYCYNSNLELVLLRPQTDYSVDYASNKDVGTAVVTVTMKGAYSGSIFRNVSIMPVSLGDAGINDPGLIAPDVSYIYSGSPVRGTTSVRYKLGGRYVTLKEGTDFTYDYSELGTGSAEDTTVYTVGIAGQGNFTGMGVFTETILPANSDMRSASKFTVTVTQKTNNLSPAKTECTPKVSVKYGKKTKLTEGVDYTVAYVNNDRIGNATVLVTGMGRYYGTKSATFKVGGISLANTGKIKLTLTPGARVYTGEAQILDPSEYTLTYNGTPLTQGVDYKVSYSNNIKAGTAVVKFKGTGIIFSGTRKARFKIRKTGIAADDITEAYTYVKSGVKPPVTVRSSETGEILKSGRDYTLKYTGNNRVNGSAYVTVTGKGNYKGNAKRYFTIEPADLGECTMSAANLGFEYKKGNVKTSVSIRDANGTKLKAGTDYKKSLTYEYTAETVVRHTDGSTEVKPANARVDTSTDRVPQNTEIRAIAYGRGNYTGEVSDTFVVTASIQNISKAVFSIRSQIYTGEAIELTPQAISKAYIGSSKIPLIYGLDYEIVAGSYVNNTEPGTANVTIRGLGAYTGQKTLSFKITAPDADTAVIRKVTRPDFCIDATTDTALKAVPNDGTDDTEAIQQAINQAGANARNGSGSTVVYLPEGIYNVTPSYYGIEMREGVSLVMDNNAILKCSASRNCSDADRNNPYDYHVISVIDPESGHIADVSIIGGQIAGERSVHKGASSTYRGHGVSICGATNVTISDMVISNCWGDGIYVGTKKEWSTYYGCNNVTVTNCEIYGNRRNNISIVDAHGMTVNRCYLHDAHGAAPQCGILIEPNFESGRPAAEARCSDITISNTRIDAYKNKNSGDYMCILTNYDPDRVKYIVVNGLNVENCTINGWYGIYSGVGYTESGNKYHGTKVIHDFVNSKAARDVVRNGN